MTSRSMCQSGRRPRAAPASCRNRGSRREPDLGGAIELTARGHVEVDAEHDLLPRTGAIVGRRVVGDFASNPMNVKWSNSGTTHASVGGGGMSGSAMATFFRADRRQHRERGRGKHGRGQQRRPQAIAHGGHDWNSLSSGSASLAPENGGGVGRAGPQEPTRLNRGLSRAAAVPRSRWRCRLRASRRG